MSDFTLNPNSPSSSLFPTGDVHARTVPRQKAPQVAARAAKICVDLRTFEDGVEKMISSSSNGALSSSVPSWPMNWTQNKN